MIFKNGAANEAFKESVLGGTDVVMENTLRDPNQYREAVLFEALAAMPAKRIHEFVISPEAKMMVTEGILKQETIDRLASHHDNKILNTTILQLAKEADDPLWQQLVASRIEERRVMNELLEKYGAQAHTVADNAYENFVTPNLPKYFDQNAE